jgi:hypothetical protein
MLQKFCYWPDSVVANDLRQLGSIAGALAEPLIAA